MYLKNSSLSLNLAQKLMGDELKPYLWVVVCSYYSMFYSANAVLLKLGYKTGDRIAHKVTSDALIALVSGQMKRELLAQYDEAREDALDIVSAKVEAVLESLDQERRKRSRLQYQMDEEAKEQKARTSLERAKLFTFEMGKLLK